MRWFNTGARLAALAALIGSSACGGSSSSNNTTAPSYTTYNDTFADGILQQGSDINAPDFGPADAPHRFTIHQASSAYPGGAEITISSMTPLSTITVGIGLTTWNATTQSCDLPLQLTTSSARVGVTVSTNQIAATGDLCVAIFDVGNVLGSTAYTITIAHT